MEKIQYFEITVYKDYEQAVQDINAELEKLSRTPVAVISIIDKGNRLLIFYRAQII